MQNCNVLPANAVKDFVTTPAEIIQEMDKAVDHK